MTSLTDSSDVAEKPLCLGGWRWFFVYALLATLVSWPLAGSITTHISYGHENEITVPMLNLWTVWWNADRFFEGFRGYWNSPIFYPTEKTFVFSEAQPTSIIVSPILGLTDNRGLAYNVYQLLILALNGFSAHRLLRRIGHIPWLAFCGGAMSQILPFVIWQFGVVQLTTMFGIHWTLHAVMDLFGQTQASMPQSSSRDARIIGCLFRVPLGVRLGLAYGLTYWLCNYWGLFLTLLLVPSSLCFSNRRWLDKSFWIDVGLAAVVAIAMIGPFAWLQHSLSREHQWQGWRTRDLVQGLSAHWQDYTDVPWVTLTPWLEIPSAGRKDVWALGGGGLKLILVPIGVIAAFVSRGRRRWGVFAVTFGALAFGLSLGPTVRFAEGIPWIGGIGPYDLLQRSVPGLSLIRSPFRFAIFVQMATVWLSLEALDLLNPARWWIRDITSLNRRTLSSQFAGFFGFGQIVRYQIPFFMPLIIASLLVSLEAVPPPMRLYELPSRSGLPFWVTWLRDNAEPNSALACLPFPTGDAVMEYEDTTVWMYWSTFHRLPLVNGYSGFFPESFVKTKEGLEQFQRPENLGPSETFIPQFKHYSGDNIGLRRLNETRVTYIAMKRSFGTELDVRANPATQLRWALVAGDETAKVDIYRLPNIDD